MLVVTLFKAWVLGRFFAGIVGSNPAGSMDACLLWVLFSGRILWGGLITHPRETYQVLRVRVWSWSLDNEGALAQ